MTHAEYYEHLVDACGYTPQEAAAETDRLVGLDEDRAERRLRWNDASATEALRAYQARLDGAR